MKSCRHVSVSSDEGSLTVTPHRNLGGEGGFEPEPDLAVPCAAFASALGRTVADLLDKAA